MVPSREYLTAYARPTIVASKRREICMLNSVLVSFHLSDEPLSCRSESAIAQASAAMTYLGAGCKITHADNLPSVGVSQE